MKLLDKDGLTYYTGKIKNELTDYVKNTDYATGSKGGVVKSGSNGFNVNSSTGAVSCSPRNYATQYVNDSDYYFISKGTLENVITGKGLVSNTDYATSSVGGVIRATGNYGFNSLNDGRPYASTYDYATYQSSNNIIFISKGTLENVLTAKIGDIQTLLDNLNTGNGV